jgi:NADH-quinone oxidoreductase subunit A
MSNALSGSVGVVGYLTLFGFIGLLFVFVNLLIGRFLRPRDPHREKLEIYECGEPTIGSSFVQFDLRFYVVALIFIVFDVEVAFLFPWATVFGKANHLASLPVQEVSQAAVSAASGIAMEMGLPGQALVPGQLEALVRTGQSLSRWAAIEVLVFFGILLVGYIYVWGTGALEWIRTSPQTDSVERRSETLPVARPRRASPALSA